MVLFVYCFQAISCFYPSSTLGRTWSSMARLGCKYSSYYFPANVFTQVNKGVVHADKFACMWVCGVSVPSFFSLCAASNEFLDTNVFSSDPHWQSLLKDPRTRSHHSLTGVILMARRMRMESRQEQTHPIIMYFIWSWIKLVLVCGSFTTPGWYENGGSVPVN